MGWLSNLFGSKKLPVVSASKNSSFDSGDIRAVVVSDLGNIRTNNEDMGLFFKIADDAVIRNKGYVLMVTDGMGGHNAGEVASKMATDIISHEYYKQNNGSIEKTLDKVLRLANKNIYDKATSNSAFKGMGTTCTVLVVLDQSVYFAHVGDSRAYIQKGSSIFQITEDHTFVQELVNKGDITAAEAATHPKRNILTNAMGTKPELRVDTGKSKYAFEKNDKLLICSDGLYDYLNDNELQEILQNSELMPAASLMIKKAKERGGHDNITVVLAGKKSNAAETELKLTRDVELPKMTRDADLPDNL